MSEDLIKLNGKFTYVVYRSEDTYYTVAKFRVNDTIEKVIFVVGIMPEIRTNCLYNIYGNYTRHPRYGMQFRIETYELPAPDEEEAIVRYLSGVQFPGVGKKTAKKIADTLGKDCIEKIRNDPDILNTIEGLSEKHIESIKNGIGDEQNDMEELVRFLNVHGIGMRNLTRLNKAYGKEAMKKIRENPYRVIEECEGFGFITADKIAKSLGIEDDDPRRLYAMLVSLVMELCVSKGHSFIYEQELRNAYIKETGSESYYEQAYSDALMKRRIVAEEDRVYPVSQFDAERFTARFLADFPVKKLEPYDPQELSDALHAFQHETGISYDETQIEAVRMFFENPVSIITGGPGTGKTTVVHGILNIFRELYPGCSVRCAAPTGRAAKRLSELTGAEAATIHSILQWDLESNTFGKNEDDPIDAGLLIIDEFSMVDIWLFSNLLKASGNVMKICIIGDEDQLPSVGPGNVLSDLIASGKFPLTRLMKIHRQKEGNTVIRLAHAVNNGSDDLIHNSDDVSFFEIDRASIKNSLFKIMDHALAKGYSMNDIQVLSPKYSGSAGIDTLNTFLQDCFNPADPLKNEAKTGYMMFREGDKILQLKNQPDDDVYNGDIGILEEIIPAEESVDKRTTLLVNFDGIFVEYNADNWNNITLAYCISIHKSQGSEYPIVIMPVTREMQYMLTKKLLYTGITRARKSLIILGELNAFVKGVHIKEREPRRTTLKDRILSYMDQSDPFDVF